MKNILYKILLPLTLFSCNSGQDINKARNEPVERQQIIPNEQVNELFNKISTPPQKFNISLKKDTSITCENGTVISIPKGSFIDGKGNIIDENITIEIVEAFSLADFLRYNLQTLSNGHLLESAGMIFIDAKTNNEPLTLEENSALYVELPSNNKLPEFRIFNGKHDETGNINWTETSEIDEGLIPLPLSEFDYTYFTKFVFNEEYKPLKYLDSIQLNKNASFENTFISTLEFESRFNEFHSDYWYYWENYNSNLSTAPIKTKRPYSINCPLIAIYTENLDKPLWYCDSLAYSYLKKREIEDSIIYYKSNEWTGTNQIFYSSYAFNWYSKQRLDKVKKFDDKGVDMSQSNAKDQLIKKGYSEKTAYEQILIFNSRNRIIKQRKEQKRISKERNDNQNKITKAFTVAFNVTKLGWVNVDKFYEDPTSKEVELIVNTTIDSVDFCDLTLLIPNRNVAINAINSGKNRYCFTKKETQYKKLPVGETAILIAMSSKNGQPYFAVQTFIIKEKQNIELQINKSTWTEINGALAKLK